MRVIFDPEVLSFPALLDQYLDKALGGAGAMGQYRSELFAASEEQAAQMRKAAESVGVPVASPASPEAVFWPAEDYHQKYLLRRNTGLVSTLVEAFGSRWDEHAYATKLNAAGERGFDLKPWLEEMPPTVVAAFRRNR